MRLVWRKRYGFSMVAYPVEGKTIGAGEAGGFKAGIFDGGGDLWWFSEETVTSSKETEALAYQGWEELLLEFLNSGNVFPDGIDPQDEMLAVEKELEYARSKFKNVKPITSIKEAIKEATENADDKEDDTDTNGGDTAEESSEETKEGGTE